jgi:type II secretory pathway component PulM
MRALRAFFLARQPREKAFLLIFVLLILAVWGSSFYRRAKTFYSAARATSTELNQQTAVLKEGPAIDEAEKKAAARLDPTSTLDGTRLFAAVSAMAAEAGLRNPRTGESHDEGNGQFRFHTLQFTVNGADWDALKRFYLALQRRSPYIGIDQFSLQSNRANPTQLNATMRISSVEIVR